MRTRGASPGAEPRAGRAAREPERGPGPSLPADGGNPRPRQSDHKGGCGREPRGRRGADGSGRRRPGAGRGDSGEAVAAVRLCEARTVVGLVRTPPPAPCPPARVLAHLGSVSEV